MPRYVKLLDRVYLEHDLTCPDCGSVLVLAVFQDKVIYRCARRTTTGCRGSHGAKPDGAPLGVPASWQVRQERRKAHAAFDQLWNGPKAPMSRGVAYQWLQDAMGMTHDQAHISRFDAEQSKRVVALLRSHFGISPAAELGDGQEGFFNLSL